MQKEAFFQSLYTLDDDDERPDEEHSKAAMMLAGSRKGTLPTKQGVNTNPHVRHDTARTVSTPLPKPSMVTLDISFVAATPFSSTKSMMERTSDHTLKPSSFAPTPTLPSKGRGKRKRGQSLEIMPESQRIFGGLAFCTRLNVLDQDVSLTIMDRLPSKQ